MRARMEGAREGGGMRGCWRGAVVGQMQGGHGRTCATGSVDAYVTYIISSRDLL